MYSSTVSLTSLLDWVDGKRHAPVVLHPVKIRYSLYIEPQARSGEVRKISPPSGFDPRTPRYCTTRNVFRLNFDRFVKKT
jgi:hypothetical protein